MAVYSGSRPWNQLTYDQQRWYLANGYTAPTGTDTGGVTPTSNNWWGTGDLGKVDWDKFLKTMPGIMKEYNAQSSQWAKGLGTGKTPQQVAQDWWTKWGKDTPAVAGYSKLPLKGTTPTTPPGTQGEPPKVVPGTADPNDPSQINVVDYAGELVKDPSKLLTQDDPSTKNVNESMELSDRVPAIDPNAAGTNINPNDPKYQMGTTPKAATSTAQTAQATAATTAQVDPRQAATYQAQQTLGTVTQQGQATAQQGQLSQGAIIDASETPQIDIQGTATGVNADGTVNYTGQALNQAALQNISNIIDTSTASGRELAAQLGEGNYLDKKATLTGQLEILQQQFTGPDGQPKIPAWAAGTARNVSKIASFTGMTGSAATAAMAQALMEASIPVAQQESQFFQTVTLQNLSNRQAQTINKANVLAKMDQINADNRMAAAIENSKKFMEMDLKNLDNRQQTEIINTQARVQSILEDAKAINTQRMFTAEQTNDMAKFYDNLNSQIKMHNTTQLNNMRQFNVSQANETSRFNAGQANAQNRFNAEMENNREEFYKTMQFNIDTANAKWRQTVTLADAQMKFEAAATDVKNLVGISVEQLNQIWDRSDSLLDYLWKSTENDLNRNLQLTLNKMTNDQKDQEGLGGLFGNLVGSIVGKADSLGDVFDWFSF